MNAANEESMLFYHPHNEIWQKRFKWIKNGAMHVYQDKSHFYLSDYLDRENLVNTKIAFAVLIL